MLRLRSHHPTVRFRSPETVPNRFPALLRRLALALRDPREFALRVRTLIEIRVDVLTRTPPDRSGWVEHATFLRAEDLIGRLPPPAFNREIEERLRVLAADPPFRTGHNADRALAEACYALCRVRRPDLVVETGVALGVTTAYILAALAANGTGTLHSLDFPPFGPGAADAVGSVVPDRLRERWTLHRGPARDLLPDLLQELGEVGVFVHDSLHTAYNIRRELALARPYLSPAAVVIADDVQDNDAFHRFARQEATRFYVVREADKDAAFGVAFLTAGSGWRRGSG